MRKKSHISLGIFFCRHHRSDSLMKHKKAFLFGSIQPDLNPKMLVLPHEYDATFEKLRDFTQHMADGILSGDNESVLWGRAGILMHYLADYFTGPHNRTYIGGVKGHCMYESQLKYSLRRYLRSQEASDLFCEQYRDIAWICDVDSLFTYIEERHQEYLARPLRVDSDCRWILEITTAALFYIQEKMLRELKAESKAHKKAA